MFRWGWDRLDAKLIDRRFIRRDAYNAHNPSSSYQVWEYLVEFSEDGGRPRRSADPRGRRRPSSCGG